MAPCVISSTSTTISTQSLSSKHRAPQPPPNTPLTPIFPTFNHFTSTLPTNPECPEFDEQDTLTSYGELTPVESYHPPMPPLLASPKRYAHGCLRLRLPVRRPPIPNRSTITHGGYGGWSRLVIGGDASPMSPKVPLIRSPISPSTPTLVVANMTSLSIVPPSPAPASPLPLPTRPRSSPYTTPFRAYLTVSSDPTSDSETENELESHDDGDTTCVSESDPEDDGSGKAWLKTNLAESTFSLRK